MRAKSLHVVIALVLSALFAGEVAAQVGRVNGLVRDDSGNAIKGATVIASNPNIGPTTFTATTDEKGRFTIIGLRAGQWRFLAQAPGHASDVGQLSVRFGSPNDGIALTLRKNGPPSTAPLGSVTARDLQAQLSAAEAFFNQQKWDEAIAAYRAIVAKTPALSVVQLQIAASYRNKKDYDNASAAYQALLAADPANQKARVGLASLSLDQGDAAKAEATLSTAARNADAGRDVFYTLAELKSSTGDVDEAAQFYRKAADADPAWGKPRYKLGLLAMKSGDNAGAARFMTDVVTVDPTSQEAALARTALEQLKK
jgi:tetratricopeptide (TPR) repeat protein